MAKIIVFSMKTDNRKSIMIRESNQILPQRLFSKKILVGLVLIIAQITLFCIYNNGKEIFHWHQKQWSALRRVKRAIRLRKYKPNISSLLADELPHMNQSRILLFQQINTAYINNLLEASTLVSKKRTRRQRKSFCPNQPPNLEGKIDVENSTFDKNVISEIKEGGEGQPNECQARHQVAIIIPYRDRESHLDRLINHLHPILQRQQIGYRIYVVEQFGSEKFNKGRLMNIAFVTALKQYNYQCFIFHDVDLLLENDRNLHSCPQQPRHMSVAIDKFNYTIPYQELVGGVFAIKTDHFLLVNGYSNVYWGWGAEDDDMAYRIKHVGLEITRPPTQIARYKMIKHTERVGIQGRIRFPLLWSGIRRYQIDGVSSLQRLNYTINWTKNLPLYTHIMVDIGKAPLEFQ